MRPMRAMLLTAVLAAACTTDADGEGTTTSSTIPPAATVLDVAAARWPSCLNPLVCTGDPASQLVYQHVLPRLLEVDHEGRYVPSPLLVGPPTTEIDEVTGEQVVTYRLDPDARWHDGRPVTSSDVRGTWMARINTPGAAVGLDEAIVDVDDEDPLVARVTLAGPRADWRELFGGYSGWLLQADAFGDDTDLTGQFAHDLPFGAGPFEVAGFDADEIVLAARPEHWDVDRAAEVDRVQISRVDAGGDVRSGIDVVLPGVEVDDPPAGLARRASATTEVVGLFFDQRTPALADPAVRHAVDLILDRRDLLEVTVESGEASPELLTCLSGLPTQGSCEEDLPESEEDQSAADALLSQAGWLPTENGDRLGPFGPLATPVTFDPELGRAVAIADALRFRFRTLGGVVVEERGVPAGVWRERGREESTGIGVFPVELGTPGRLWQLYSCSGGVANRMAWCPPEMAALLAELSAAIHLEDRLPIEAAIGELAAGAFAWLPLHQRTELWLVAEDRVVVPEAQPLGSGPLGALHDFARAED